MHLPPVYFAFTGIFILGLISPGPDFALITRNSLLYSHSIGRWSACGIALGILVHITYCLIGIGFIIEKSLLVFSIMKFAGAAYLVYLGVTSLLHKRDVQATTSATESRVTQQISRKQALAMGFATNALNPKAAFVFVSLFTQVLGPNVSTCIRLLYGTQMLLLTLFWFLIVATVFSRIAEKQSFKLFSQHIGRVTGIALVAFGVRLAFTQAR